MGWGQREGRFTFNTKRNTRNPISTGYDSKDEKTDTRAAGALSGGSHT